MHKATRISLPAAFAAAAALGPRHPPEPAPETVALTCLHLPPAGDYWQEARHRRPARRERLQPGFEVMKYQVSQAEYARCGRGRCLAKGQPRDDLPITGVSLLDSSADWLRRRTGQRWRLPSDLEWAFSLGRRRPAHRRRRQQPGTALAGPLQLRGRDAPPNRPGRWRGGHGTNSASPTSPATSGNGPTAATSASSSMPEGRSSPHRGLLDPHRRGPPPRGAQRLRARARARRWHRRRAGPWRSVYILASLKDTSPKTFRMRLQDSQLLSGLCRNSERRLFDHVIQVIEATPASP